MDRFKFRVYVTENVAYPEKVGYVDTDDFYIHPDGEESYFNADYDFAESVIEQCTGLKDKNGKLIYEGDIVKSGKHIYPVEWYVNGFAVNDGYDYLIDNEEWEVIGNIHENADLLGEE